MANQLEINGEYYDELARAFGDDFTGIDGPSDGKYYCTGEHGNPPVEGAPEYQDMEITLPGVDGIGIKRLGFRGRPIYFRMAFIGETKTIAERNKNEFFEELTALASFTVTVPGGTLRPSCRIVHGSAQSGQWAYWAGKMVLLVDVTLRQMRLT